jgi:hypothetical protein
MTTATKMASAEFLAEVGRWLADCQAIVDKGEDYTRGKLSIGEGGKRYLRIVLDHGDGRRVFAFIDTTNGDVLKPDGWKRPAEKARGNLFDESGGLSRINSWGPR